MKNTSWVSAILSSFLLVGGMLPAFAQLKAPQAALVGDYAYILGDSRPITVGRGYVQSAEWTQFGSAIELVKLDVAFTSSFATMALTGAVTPTITESAYLWNRKTNQSQLLERVTPPFQKIQSVEVLNNERTAVVSTLIGSTENTQTAQLRIVNGTTSEVITAPKDGNVDYVASDKGSSVLVYVTSGKMASGSVSTLVRIFDADRARWTPISLGLESNQLIEFGLYSSQMGAFVLSISGFGGGKEAYIAYSTATGNITHITAEQFEKQFEHDDRDTSSQPLLRVDRQGVRYPDNTTYSIFTLGASAESSSPTLRNGSPARADRVLYFCAGADYVVLSPREDAVIVLRDGTVSVQDVIKVDRALMEGKTGPETREQLISRAKQVGTGLIMYAGDHDDELPPADGMKERIMPYLKDESLLDGFIYTYSGPLNMSNINDPANTELGFIRGVGGSAVLYADSSVRWKPDP